MAWKTLETKTVKCTKGLVKEYAGMTPAPGDRSFKDRIANFIRKQIEGGTYRSAGFASVYCKETGIEYRLNGKHTATVLSEMNGDFPSAISAHIEKYEAESLHDVASLYATFDSRSSARTTGDINRSYASSDEDLAEVPAVVINIGVAGIDLARRGGELESSMGRLTAEEKAEAMYRHKGFFEFLWRLNISDPKAAHLRRSAVVAAAFLMYQKAPEKAMEFWLAVRDGSGSDHTAADRVLNKYLLVTGVRSQSSSAKKKSDTTRAMFVRCVHAWNAWRRGEKTDLRYYEDAFVPRIV